MHRNSYIQEGSLDLKWLCLKGSFDAKGWLQGLNDVIARCHTRCAAMTGARWPVAKQRWRMSQNGLSSFKRLLKPSTDWTEESTPNQPREVIASKS
ncbi:hypothetical protein O181_023303, partial [Austropuccinia psidii MF-1]|nr:hypothetical protein [Austropuccinia psidii MF-1]